MLACQQRRRHYHRNLFATDCRDEGRPQRHFGLPETDIAADQPVHRTAGAQIPDGRVNGHELVVGFLVRKTRAELVIGARPNGQSRRLAHLPFGRNLDQFARNFADSALHARLARLPVAATKTIEIDLRLLGAVARQKIHVLDRQIELGAFGVVNFKAVMGRASRLDWLESLETANTMVHMDHQITGSETGSFGDEIIRSSRSTTWPHEAIAEDVLLADNRDVIGLETG